MTKKELMDVVYAETGLSHSQTQQAVQATFDSLIKILIHYGRVELRGFGVFMLQQRAPRKARNPRTGEELVVPARESIVFKPSPLFKQELESSRETLRKQTNEANS